ncbi:MAG: CoA pyrophosphatase [Prolixibacteraceae bacterium]|jgi:8-oxo-dGTP pyrophosphatase MutT (NUDIX family)|nr:CoA pyrophosphatase [Prolixibacteraceae bacterium]
MDSNLSPDIWIKKVKKRLELLLPGSVSHVKMLPPGRALMLPSDQINYHESAVLILLFPLKDRIHICLIKRPSTMKNHAGQIAFPGGKREKEDSDLVHTALREAQEEIGIEANAVEILGFMSDVYVQISDFLITPVVGWLNEFPEAAVVSSEVDEIIFISLEDLANSMSRCEREMDTRTGRIKVPGYEINGCFIWGATAMMLAELVDIFLDDVQL